MCLGIGQLNQRLAENGWEWNEQIEAWAAANDLLPMPGSQEYADVAETEGKARGEHADADATETNTAVTTYINNELTKYNGQIPIELVNLILGAWPSDQARLLLESRGQAHLMEDKGDGGLGVPGIEGDGSTPQQRADDTRANLQATFPTTAELRNNSNSVNTAFDALGGTPTGVPTSPLGAGGDAGGCLLYTSPSPRDRQKSRMPSSA